MNYYEDRLEKILTKIVDDYDQTGCSDDLGTINKSLIQRARKILGMEPLPTGETEIPEVFHNYPGSWEALCELVEKNYTDALFDLGHTVITFITDELRVEEDCNELWYSDGDDQFRWNEKTKMWDS